LLDSTGEVFQVDIPVNRALLSDFSLSRLSVYSSSSGECFIVSKVPTTDPARIIALHVSLVERLRARPDVAVALAGEPASIVIRLKDPDIVLRLMLDGSKSALTSIDAVDSDIDDVTITMKWETAHRFWLGEADLMSSLLTGKIKVEGRNMDPLFRLKTIVHQAQDAYKEILSESDFS
jgi:putative sterol carrier protein